MNIYNNVCLLYQLTTLYQDIIQIKYENNNILYNEIIPNIIKLYNKSKCNIELTNNEKKYLNILYDHLYSTLNRNNKLSTQLNNIEQNINNAKKKSNNWAIFILSLLICKNNNN